MNFADGSLEVEQLADKVWVWVWTSTGGAYLQGPKQYKRRADAHRAGQQWLDERRQR